MASDKTDRPAEYNHQLMVRKKLSDRGIHKAVRPPRCPPLFMAAKPLFMAEAPEFIADLPPHPFVAALPQRTGVRGQVAQRALHLRSRWRWRDAVSVADDDDDADDDNDADADDHADDDDDDDDDHASADENDMNGDNDRDTDDADDSGGGDGDDGADEENHDNHNNSDNVDEGNLTTAISRYRLGQKHGRKRRWWVQMGTGTRYWAAHVLCNAEMRRGDLGDGHVTWVVLIT
eukprot:3260452-Rhodomonas_salina.1